MFEDPETPPDRLEDDPLHPLRGNFIGGDDEDRPPGPGIGLGEIADRGLGELAVGNDDVGVIERDHLRGPPIDLHHPTNVSLIGVVLDPITDLERMLGVDGEAGEDVAEGVFEGEAEHRGDQSRAGDQFAGVDPGIPKDDQQRHRQHHAAEDVDEDLRHRPGDAFPAAHHHQEEARLEKRCQEKEPLDMVGMAEAMGHTGLGISDSGLREEDDREQRNQRQGEERDRKPGEPASPAGGGDEKQRKGRHRQDSLPDGRGVGPEDEIVERVRGSDFSNHQRFRRAPRPPDGAKEGP